MRLGCHANFRVGIEEKEQAITKAKDKYRVLRCAQDDNFPGSGWEIKECDG
jgi:hypothetical protein